MKLKKTIIITTCVVVSAGFCVCGLSLEKIADRNTGNCLPAELKSEIVEETRGMSGREIIDYSIKKTGKVLKFGNNNDINLGCANCVGYAQTCSKICNHAFKANKVNGYSKPVVGNIKCYGINVCDVAKSVVPHRWENFVKDHDFVEVHLEDNGFFVDPSIYDYTGLDLETRMPN